MTCDNRKVNILATHTPVLHGWIGSIPDLLSLIFGFWFLCVEKSKSEQLFKEKVADYIY